MAQPFLRVEALAKRFATADGELTVFDKVDFGPARTRHLACASSSQNGELQ
jgi:hypothetical protein